MDPSLVSSTLKKIASSLELDIPPSSSLLRTKLSLLIAELEDKKIVVLSSGKTPGSEYVQDTIETELMRLGAESVNWDPIGKIYAVFASVNHIDLLESIDELKSGTFGEDVSEYSQSIRLVSSSIPIHKGPVFTIARKKKSKKVVVSQPRVQEPIQTEDMLAPVTEYACQVDLSMTASFEGKISTQKLLKKFRSELVAAIKTAASTTANEFQIKATGVQVKPIRMDVAINDEGSIEENAEFDKENEINAESYDNEEENEPDEYEIAKKRKKNKK